MNKETAEVVFARFAAATDPSVSLRDKLRLWNSFCLDPDLGLRHDLVLPVPAERQPLRPLADVCPTCGALRA